MGDVINDEDSLDAVKEPQYKLIQLLKSTGMHLHVNGNLESFT